MISVFPCTVIDRLRETCTQFILNAKYFMHEIKYGRFDELFILDSSYLLEYFNITCYL